MRRRAFLELTAGAGLVAAAGLAFAPSIIGRAIAAPTGGQPLPLPPVLDLDQGAGATLETRAGSHAFYEGASAATTLGYGQNYLGPILRARRGGTARVSLANRLDAPVATHWHGLHIPGSMDGGPQMAVAPGAGLTRELEIDQPAGTYWYHSHTHGLTAEQVYQGLAGFFLIEDPEAPDPGLPDELGVDDLPLAVQDRNFSPEGHLRYSSGGMMMMNGMKGDAILVNGALRPVASVPGGLVRLRLLNGSNARIYHFFFEDGRGFHQVASDGGLLQAPVAMERLTLAPGERAEIVVDFSTGGTRLLSADDNNAMMGMMGGMMSRIMGGGSSPDNIRGADGFEIMSFEVDPARRAARTSLPATLPGAPNGEMAEPVARRRISLEMMHGMRGGGGMMGGMMGGRGGDSPGPFSINGKPYDMGRIDVAAKLGTTELWEVVTDGMAHPFHVHGTSFKVLNVDGRAMDFATTGLKDVVLVRERAEILVPFNRPADRQTPFMFHCHILEHEDNGMMGQMTVS
ncbi:cell division protein SufI [Brevirhabdus pacifica]|uniref:multicopper oxidase family protein n=1 Tax=Brevirhabdus pacifica TaxID=1267768 RepID=UPI000CB42158|nr:multicopper oxidase domain-containing protein [Brevirhabdus pacifica]PJJ86404.1 cell division protein SufI [Brevirhabdus pacifica]